MVIDQTLYSIADDLVSDETDAGYTPSIKGWFSFEPSF